MYGGETEGNTEMERKGARQTLSTCGRGNYKYAQQGRGGGGLVLEDFLKRDKSHGANVMEEIENLCSAGQSPRPP